MKNISTACLDDYIYQNDNKIRISDESIISSLLDQHQIERSITQFDILRPLDHTMGYSIDKYVIENHKNLEDMPMNAVFSSIFFLLNLGIELSTVMMNYLDQNKEIDKDLINSVNLGKNGVGINQYTHSLKAILDDLKISQN